MKEYIARDDAFELLKKYNKDPFHIQHALTVEAVMKWYANELGYGEDSEYWGIVGLLHDIDFELYPAEHCLKAPELLRDGGVSEDIIHAVCSHGYGITVECGTTIDVEPVHEMEKVLFAADELTGLIWAAPRSITSLEQPAANPLLLYFFFRDFSSISFVLFDGRINAAAQIRPSFFPAAF